MRSFKVYKHADAKINNNLSPFNHELYKVQKLNKIWVFISSLILILMLIYLRTYYYKLLQMRITSIWSNFQFKELLNEPSSKFRLPTILIIIFTIVTFAQTVIILLTLNGIYIQKYYSFANDGIFLIVLFSIIAILRIVVVIIQFLYSHILQIENAFNAQLQQQINIDLLFAIIFLPIGLILYYNYSAFLLVNISFYAQMTLVIWLIIRLFMQILGIFRIGALNLNEILYFCTLEILPLLILMGYMLKNK